MKKKMAQLHSRPWFFWIGGACFFVGSLVAGSFSLASAGPTVSGTVVANQGTSGSSSWPVTASQMGVWQQELTDGTNVLGTSTHPLRTDPTGTTSQPVSGTVNVGNLPTTQAVSGTVNVGNLPATQQVSGSVTSADTSSVITETQVTPTASSENLVVGADVSSAKEIRVSVTCSESASCGGVEVGVFTDTSKSVYPLGYFTLGSSFDNSQTFDVPGTNITVAAFGTDTTMTIDTLVVGRSN